jgi:hypothetical protein
MIYAALNEPTSNATAVIAGHLIGEPKSPTTLTLSEFVLGVPMRTFHGYDNEMCDAQAFSLEGQSHYRLRTFLNGEISEDETVTFDDLSLFYYRVRNNLLALH